MIRKSVDLPQPDGPTKTTNSLSWIARSISNRTCAGPNDFEILFSSSVAIGGSLRSARLSAAKRWDPGRLCSRPGRGP